MSRRDMTISGERVDNGPLVGSRRRYLAALGTGLTAGVAGCSGVRPIGSARAAPMKPDADDFLVERRAGHPVDDGIDVDAVDGDLGQLTWEQFSAVEGHIDVTCVRKETHVSLHLWNLVPKGLYTAWSVVFAEDEHGRGFIDDRDLGVAVQNLAGFGPLGASGTIEACALDQFEWHVIAGLHLDGQTHGSHFDDPDNPGAAVEQASFVFKNGHAAG